MKKLLEWYKLLATISVIVAVVLFVIGFFEASHLSDVFPNRLYLARTSPDAATLAVRTSNIIQLMNEYDMKEGWGFLASEQTGGDIGFAYTTLTAIQEKSQAISKLDELSSEYQLAFNNVRLTLSTLEIAAGRYRFGHSPTIYYSVRIGLANVIGGILIILIDLIIWYLRPKRQTRHSPCH